MKENWLHLETRLTSAGRVAGFKFYRLFIFKASPVFPIKVCTPVAGCKRCAFNPIPAIKRKNNAVTVVHPMIILHEMETKFSAGLSLNKNIEPNRTDTMPPIVKMP